MPMWSRIRSSVPPLLLGLAGCLVAGGIRAAGPPPATPNQLTFDIIFGENAGGRVATDATWAPDGRHLVYRWWQGEAWALWQLDAASGERRVVLAPPALAAALERESGEAPEVDGFQLTPAGDALLVEAAGDLLLFPLDGRPGRRLTATPGAESDPKVSPDGRRVAFVRGADLFVIDLASGEERALTSDGEPDRLLNGQTDWVYGEEIWDRQPAGHWWSPDGSRIAFYRFEEEGVARYPLVDFLPLYPRVAWQPYPKAGEANPRVRVGVLDLATGGTVWLATGEDPEDYLARVVWLPDGRRVAVERLNRGQDRLDLLSCDAAGGLCAPLLTETAGTWVNLAEAPTFLADGRFVWSSEKSGWRRLYLHAADGSEVRPLTPEGWAVTALDALNQEQGWIAYTAYATSELGAAGRRLFRAPLGELTTPLVTLGREEGWNAEVVAPASGLWVHSWSDADTPESLTVRAADGRLLGELPSEPPAAFDAAALPAWQLLTIPGPEGSRLPAAMLRPAGFDPGRRYPVIVYHYGCPASQVVADRWGARARPLWHKMMAQRGYVVFLFDNQASLFFGKTGEDREHRRLGASHQPALASAAAYLRGLPWVDPHRLGIWGWSGGGSNTLAALLMQPGVWRAGMAGAPVTDWHLYDSIWTERYLDHPAENPDGYRASSPVSHAGNLTDALLVVHGTADDNVHAQNTLVLSEALIAAGKPFEMALYPGQKHGFRGAHERHVYERMTELFARWLGTPAAAAD